MSPLEFRNAWTSTGDSLVKFDSPEVATLRVSEETRTFLATIGLPEEAAPFLDFGSRSIRSLPTIAQVWKAPLPAYRIIGSNGHGDPICIAEENGGRVAYLNHDDDMRVEFMNSSVSQLAYSLLAFRSVVRETNALGGRDAFLEGRIPPEVVDRFITQMDRIDAEAIKAERFWFRSIVGGGT